ncbi:methionine sulfoxide reductase A [Mizugakiibacter sediminis]|uniref:Peptide methionine sulfoxide reductase MsrA n=1 Tax=Mizugakiibacter sediminis TaxID=1475481 RepID=A0A0K8QNL5_9GAMM|nr:peptide-methionine (S)-S-oxide reductase MsrA [Mizugakiibacter sediminis]GAP66012.1 methionine sulfoxide reductase A [Mizugakiibacter sediminis]
MAATCDIRGASLRIAPDQFPDPVRDLDARGAAERSAVLAGGCFWCVEAVFRELDGVLDATSGYAGGRAADADYRTVCGGDTGHAEVVRVRYDPRRLSYGQLLKVFFAVAHDPTQRNRQGNDVGTQYRSAIFYADADERAVAAAYIRQLDAAGVFTAPIATTLEPLEAFYPAEAYHQNYAALHPEQPYIALVSAPKVEKLRTYFGERVKPTDATSPFDAPLSPAGKGRG